MEEGFGVGGKDLGLDKVVVVLRGKFKSVLELCIWSVVWLYVNVVSFVVLKVFSYIFELFFEEF